MNRAGLVRVLGRACGGGVIPGPLADSLGRTGLLEVVALAGVAAGVILSGVEVTEDIEKICSGSAGGSGISDCGFCCSLSSAGGGLGCLKSCNPGAPSGGLGHVVALEGKESLESGSLGGDSGLGGSGLLGEVVIGLLGAGREGCRGSQSCNLLDQTIVNLLSSGGIGEVLGVLLDMSGLSGGGGGEGAV